MPLTEDQKRDIDKMARSLPDWQTHLAKFRAKHPELSPQEVMKKAGFTFRMKKGKLFKAFLNKLLNQVVES